MTRWSRADDLDEDVGELAYSIDDHYRMLLADPPGDLPDLDGALRSIFEDPGRPEHAPDDAPRVPASGLLLKIERELTA